ncbi:MAG TPA: hypothetical protein VK972_00040 [Wenzhouxiangella sp.]|nr:hypothetical protein [Wenzhouxiangella sp.]
MDLIDVLFLIAVVCWAIGAGTLAWEHYHDENDYGSSKLRSGVTAAAWFCFWWMIYAWTYWAPKVKERWLS